MTAINGIDNNLIKISINSKNYDGKLNSKFESKTVQVKELPEIVKSNNYSLITWHNGIRKSDNFESASGFTVDVDKDLSLEEAKKRLDDGEYNYILASSKSHTTKDNRYHIILFFSNPVYSAKAYGKINEQICDKLFPESDLSVKDAGRFIFGSLDDAIVKSNFGGKSYNVLAIDGLWDKSLEIVSDKNEKATVEKLDKTVSTSCYCPFHEDSNPSAFVMFNERTNNWRISCMTCGETLWMERQLGQLEILLDDYFHYSTNIQQMGLVSGIFFIHPIDREAFHVLSKTNGTKEEKTEAYAILVDKKHISHMVRVDFIGDTDTNEDYYNIDVDSGIVTVHYSPIQEVKKDNDFIEKYFEDRFGNYKSFIKEYLAVYCQTNYEKLPTLVFNSARGNGKSTFVELIGSIYPHLTMEWNGTEGDFSYEAEKKLLIVEENDTSGVKQYKTLKKYMGQKNALVKKKYEAPYSVKNNRNVAILSNEKVPMFVKRTEMPTNESNNQFFVWEFPEFSEPINGKMREELEARLGHYIKTELKKVFDGLTERTKYRYSINVPITEYERILFEDNISDIELEANELVDELCAYKEANDDGNHYFPLLNKGWLPSEFVKNRFQRNHHDVISELKKQYLLEGGAIAKWNGFRKPSSYKMTKKLIGLFTEGQKELEVLKN